jgi:hypothetical protein
MVAESGPFEMPKRWMTGFGVAALNAKLTPMLTLTIARFDVDPDAVTDILGLTPTSVARRGEPRPSGRLHESNMWHLELHAAPLVDGREHENALAELIGQLKGREHLFAEMAKTVGPGSVSIYGGFYVSDEQQGIWLNPEQMAVLATCGIGWGLDLFEAAMLS